MFDPSVTHLAAHAQAEKKEVRGYAALLLTCAAYESRPVLAGAERAPAKGRISYSSNSGGMSSLSRRIVRAPVTYKRERERLKVLDATCL